MENVLGWIAFLVALLSALYARWVWAEARTTNLLSLHANRMKFFRAFLRLRQLVQMQGLGIKINDVKRFYYLAVESKFYFSEDKSSKLLGQYFEVCFSLAEESYKSSRGELTDSQRDEIERRQDELSDQEQSLFSETQQRLEKELCLVSRRKWYNI